MTQKKGKLSLKELTVTSFTTELHDANGFRAGAEDLEQPLGSFIQCTGGGYVGGLTNCC